MKILVSKIITLVKKWVSQRAHLIERELNFVVMSLSISLFDWDFENAALSRYNWAQAIYKPMPEHKAETWNVQIVTCSAPEGVDLALSEMWALSTLTTHPNIIRFNGAYLDTNGEFELLKHGDRRSSRYRRLVEVTV